MSFSRPATLPVLRLPSGRWSALLPALAFVALTLWSWAKWPDPVIDYGQQLYVAWRVAAGEVLYRDLAYFHGPLSSWIHGGLGALLGVRLVTLAVFNLGVIAALTALLLRLLGRWVAPAAATTGALVFLTVFAFSQVLPVGNYNWVTPYTSEITHGVALGLAAVWAVVRHAERRRQGHRAIGWLVAAGLLFGLVSLTKVEVFLALGPALLAGLLAAPLCSPRFPSPASPSWSGSSGVRSILGGGLAFSIAAAVPPFLALIALAPALGWIEAAGALASPYRAAARPALAELPLYAHLSGFDQPLRNLGLLFVALGLVAGTLGLLTLLTWLAGRRPFWKLVAASGLVGVLALGTIFFDSVPWFQLARPLPLLVLTLLAWTGRRLFRRRTAGSSVPPAEVGLFTLSLFALLLLAKMSLSTRTYHYGFALAMPGVVLLVALTVDRLPEWVARRGGRGPWLRNSLLALVVLFAFAHLSATAERFAARTVWIDAGWDGFWADGRGTGVNAALAALESLSDPDDEVLVVPSGVMINYLSRRRTATPYLNWVPTETESYGEKRMLEALKRSPPKWVILVERSTAELGARSFGRDYARDIGRWIRRWYVPVGGVGPTPLTGAGFGVRWMVRLESPTILPNPFFSAPRPR